MKLSARNQLWGKVKAIKEGGVISEVVIEIDGGAEIVSVITMGSLKRLNLSVGSHVMAAIKSTEVMLATEN